MTEQRAAFCRIINSIKYVLGKITTVKECTCGQNIKFIFQFAGMGKVGFCMYKKFMDLSIKYKLMLSFGIILVIFLSVSGSQVYIGRQSINQFTAVYN